MNYDELLTLCGYEPEEIERERPRIEKAFRKLEFTPEDIARGEKRVRQYYDIELTSIRKVLGLWIKSLIDLVLAKEEGKKVIYTAMPPMFQVLNAMAMASKDVYVIAPDIILAQTLGGIFDKLSPILEVAEGDLLPAGSAFCGGIQAKLGAIMKGVIPVPDLLVSTGFVCDQTPKIDERLGERYGIPVAYVDSPHDAYQKNWPQVSDERVKYLAQESIDALTKFKEVTGYSATEEMGQRANLRAADLRKRCDKVFDLVRNADPTPTGFNNVGNLVRSANAVVNTTTFAEDIEGLIDLFYKELKERIDRGEGVLPKGAPRIGITMIYCDPAPISMMEKSGLAVVIDLSGLVTTNRENIPSRYEDFWERGAESLLRWLGAKLARRLTQVCKEWDLDGAILNFPIGCRELCVAPHKAKQLITKELGIPVLLLESDHVDTRHYSAESMKSRVEAFAEVLKAAKAAKTK
jgi:benzoyl-CoA reductase/2-hydroxyglutaryl-CoA dehydratase subunit BcrC/BadD/HgdB